MTLDYLTTDLTRDVGKDLDKAAALKKEVSVNGKAISKPRNGGITGTNSEETRCSYIFGIPGGKGRHDI